MKHYLVISPDEMLLKTCREMGWDSFLVAYPTWSKYDLHKYFKERGIENPKLFIDSGAFTAYTKGIKIDIDAYSEFIERNMQ